MQKVIDIPGYGEVEFPDSMSEDQVNAAAAKLYKDSSQKTTAPAQAAAPPQENPLQTTEAQSLLGATPADMLNRLKGAARSVGRVGMGGLQYGQYLAGAKVSPTPMALEPSLDPNQAVGEKVGQLGVASLAGGGSLPVQAATGALTGGLMEQGEGGTGTTGALIGGALPVAAKVTSGAISKLRSMMSTEPAASKFEQVMAKAKDVPLNTAEAEKAVLRAEELLQRGSTMPKVIRDFIKSDKPMTYEVGRDFASNASGLSSREATALNSKMHRQVSTFAAALKDANREAAASVGMEDVYDAAMKEYRQAKTLQDAAEVLKKWGGRALAVAALGAAGAKGVSLYGELSGK